MSDERRRYQGVSLKYINLILILLTSILQARSVCPTPYSDESVRNFLKQETPIVKYLTPIEIRNTESGLETIDCIYVINLDRRPEKWKMMESLFEKNNLKANRVKAVDGWVLPREILLELAGPYSLNMVPGHIGCLLSHVSVVNDAYKRGFNWIWVCEDDVKFVNDIRQLPNLLNTLSEIDPDWDIFYTDADTIWTTAEFYFRPDQPHKPENEYLKRIAVNKQIATTGIRWGNYSYFLSKKGIKKVLDYFTHVFLWCPYDCDIHYVPDIKEYSSRHVIVTVNREITISDTVTDPERQG